VEGRLGFLFASGIPLNFLKEFYKDKKNSWAALNFFFKIMADHLLKGKVNGLSRPILEAQTVTLEAQDEEGKALTPTNGANFIFSSTVPRVFFGLNLFKKIDPLSLTSHQELLALNLGQNHLLESLFSILVYKKFLKEDICLHESITSCYLKGLNHEYSLDGDIIKTAREVIQLKAGPMLSFICDM
jgi:hypothetical protein